MEKNKLYELEIDSIAEDGSGIGRLTGWLSSAAVCFRGNGALSVF